MADAVARHQQRGLLQWLPDVQRVHGRAHDGGKGGAPRIQWRIGQGHAGQQVVPREDAQRHTLRIQRQHRANAVRVHQAQGLVQGGIGRHRHRQAPPQRRQGLFEGLLRERLRARRSGSAPLE